MKNLLPSLLALSFCVGTLPAHAQIKRNDELLSALNKYKMKSTESYYCIEATDKEAFETALGWCLSWALKTERGTLENDLAVALYVLVLSQVHMRLNS